MLRKAISKKNIGAQDGFVWRGSEITRFEGLCDARSHNFRNGAGTKTPRMLELTQPPVTPE